MPARDDSVSGRTDSHGCLQSQYWNGSNCLCRNQGKCANWNPKICRCGGN